MAVKFGNVKSIKYIEAPLGDGNNRAGVAVVTFDLVASTVYTGGADTLQLGSASASQAYENGALSAAALPLSTMFQNRRRDGRTVTLLQAMSGWGGAQASATNGPDVFAQSAAITAGNLSVNLFSAATAGSAVTTTTSQWDRAASVLVLYKATYAGNVPE